VTDPILKYLASKPIHRLTLADLVKHGRPPLSADALFRSANFTLSILPSRLAQRIQALRNLPYIVATNPHVAKIHANYLHSLSTLLPWAEKEIRDLESEQAFSEVMGDLVETHADTIPVLARGLLEARRYISPAEVTTFLDQHLRARIGTRLIAEQHLALHYSSQPQLEAEGRDPWEVQAATNPRASFIGVIDTQLSPANVVGICEALVGDICEFKYGIRPQVVISGETEYVFAQIPTHLEYILMELLKNAFRATIENQTEKEPIEVTIAPLPESPRPLKGRDVEDDATDSTIWPMEEATPGVTIRIRDRGGGISPKIYERIWDYNFTTFKDHQSQSGMSGGSNGGPNSMAGSMDGLNMISNAGGSSLAGLGYGLPLGRAYAQYFGGGIAVQSMWGWGTDVYLSLKGVGKVDGIR
jgi:signal transduction histidine kinase